MPRLLIVGAGGIGCELMKVLAREGYRDLTVVDLDTIDFSNLNRQFLFRKRHVGLAKADCVAEAIASICPEASLTALHSNIMDSTFDVNFFKQFAVVLNALDNLQARSHVNRMCLAADVPLVEAGSTGYNGQVFPIIPRLSACYDCEAKPRQRVYPVCTLRSTPDKPEHCIAWSKHLFSLLFGVRDEDNLLADMKHLTEQLSERPPHEAASDLYTALFIKHVEEHASLPDAWLQRKPPIPAPAATDVETPIADDFAAPTVEQAAAAFLDATRAILTDRGPSVGSLVFDKDDELAMSIVAAASNLRMYNYHIQPVSRWKAQEIAGQIIPAIASTNAIVAGLQVAQLRHILDYQKAVALCAQQKRTPPVLDDSGIRFCWVRQQPSGRFLVLPTPLDPPSASCSSCQCAAIIVTLHNIPQWSMRDFVRLVLRRELNLKEPLLQTGSACVYDPDDDDEEVLLNTLDFWDLNSGSILSLNDLQQTMAFDIILAEDGGIDEDEHPDRFRVERQQSRKRLQSPEVTTPPLKRLK
ncbi:MAG: uncharacterized protein KVP18_000487 [Porospora cf. gigantea A]|uniref:uncharacterized protein n=1 Tax=Porospora cf. gigantea A TaxID=2853593 RepID=UPI00355A8D34|nr:MAG: hypothetical protein KVP18_000487 [Porospora cf. gigantea A]